jgi:hypothetical protein
MDCFRPRSSSYGGQVVAALLAMTGQLHEGRFAHPPGELLMQHWGKITAPRRCHIRRDPIAMISALFRQQTGAT